MMMMMIKLILRTKVQERQLAQTLEPERAHLFLSPLV